MKKINLISKSALCLLAFFFHLIFIYGILLAVLSFFFNADESLIKLSIKEFLYLSSIVITVFLFFKTKIYYPFNYSYDFNWDINMVKVFFRGFTFSSIIILFFASIAINTSNVNLIFNHNIQTKDVIIGTLLLLFAAISEEIIFRFVLPLLILNFIQINIIFIHLFVSVLFTMVHAINPAINLISLINILLGGITLSMMYLSTNNLSLPIGFHFGWNISQSLIFGINLGGFKLPQLFHINGQFLNKFIGTSSQFESSPLLTLILFLFTLTYLYLMKNKFVVFKLK